MVTFIFTFESKRKEMMCHCADFRHSKKNFLEFDLLFLNNIPHKWFQCDPFCFTANISIKNATFHELWIVCILISLFVQYGYPMIVVNLSQMGSLVFSLYFGILSMKWCTNVLKWFINSIFRDFIKNICWLCTANSLTMNVSSNIDPCTDPKFWTALYNIDFSAKQIKTMPIVFIMCPWMIWLIFACIYCGIFGGKFLEND